MIEDRTRLSASECHCLAARQAARRVTQFYDQFMSPFGLRSTQFSILSILRRVGPLTINALAVELVMDRTTLGRNIRPLQRNGFVTAAVGKSDRRIRELQLTPAGLRRINEARKGWIKAQAAFEDAYGKSRAVTLRGMLHEVSTTEWPAHRQA